MIPLIAIAATTRILGLDTKPMPAMRLDARIGKGDRNFPQQVWLFVRIVL
jgi:hypothetical protein